MCRSSVDLESYKELLGKIDLQKQGWRDLGLCDTKLGDTRPELCGGGWLHSFWRSLDNKSEVSELPGDFKEVYDTQNWVVERLFYSGFTLEDALNCGR